MTWTPERITELTELWECGCPTKEIARIMRLTKNQAIGKARRLGLEKRERPTPARKQPTQRTPPTWTPERNERLTELHKAGASSEAIARDLGLRKRSVVGQLSLLGLTRRPVARPKKQEQGSVTLLRDVQKYAPLHRVHKCQYIEGEPSADDSCKCGKPAQVGWSECPDHHAICYYTPSVKRAA